MCHDDPWRWSPLPPSPRPDHCVGDAATCAVGPCDTLKVGACTLWAPPLSDGLHGLHPPMAGAEPGAGVPQESQGEGEGRPGRPAVTRFQDGDHYDTCTICLERFWAGELVSILPCAHGTHRRLHGRALGCLPVRHAARPAKRDAARRRVLSTTKEWKPGQPLCRRWRVCLAFIVGGFFYGR